MMDILRDNMLNEIANSNAHFKSQQRNEPELTYQEKHDIAEGILNSSPSTFLSRFGTFLKSEHLDVFKDIETSEQYEVNFYLKKLQKTNCRQVTPAQIRNRRYTALNKLLCEGEYFSLEEMRKRNPLLYEQLLGKYIDDEVPSRNCASLVDILLENIDQDRVAELKRKQKEEFKSKLTTPSKNQGISNRNENKMSENFSKNAVPENENKFTNLTEPSDMVDVVKVTAMSDSAGDNTGCPIGTKAVRFKITSKKKFSFATCSRTLENNIEKLSDFNIAGNYNNLIDDSSESKLIWGEMNEASNENISKVGYTEQISESTEQPDKIKHDGNNACKILAQNNQYESEFYSEMNVDEICDKNLSDCSTFNHINESLASSNKKLKKDKTLKWGGYSNEKHREDETIGMKRWRKSNKKNSSFRKSAEDEADDEDKFLLADQFMTVMISSFMRGEDCDFDYSTVDENPDYDDMTQYDLDEEEKYFESESPN